MYKVLFIIAIFRFSSVPASAQYVTPSPVQDVQNGRCPDLSKGGPMPAIIPIYDSVTGEECEPLQPQTQQQPTQERPQINLTVGNLTNNTIYSDSRLHIKLGVQGETSGIKNAYFVIKDPDNGIDQVYKFQEFNKTEYVDVTEDFVHYKNVTIGALILYTDGSEEILVYSDSIQYSKFPSDYTEGGAELPSPTNPGTWVGLTLQVADALSDATMRCIGLERSALGLNISEDNQLLSCVGIFLPNIQKAGRVVKLLNKGGETYEIVRAITRNGNTILELTPVRKALPYVDEVTEQIPTVFGSKKVQRSFKSSESLFNHFSKHAHRVGVATSQDYLQKAFEHSIREADNISVFRKIDPTTGKIYTFNTDSWEFSVVNRDGKIASYFIVNIRELNEQLIKNYGSSAIIYGSPLEYYKRQGSQAIKGLLSN